VVELADLQRFLRDPVAHFVQHRLGLRFPDRRESPSLLVPLDLTGLDRYDVGSRLFAWLLAGGDRVDWERIERRRGTLGPGSLADGSLDEVDAVAGALVAAAHAAGLRSDDGGVVPVDITLDDGTRVVGSVADLLAGRPGPVRATYSSDRPAYRVAAWLDLVALVANDPSVPWRSVSIAKHPSKAAAVGAEYGALEHTDAETRRRAALQGLTVAVDCYRRGRCEPLPLFPLVSYDLAHDGSGLGNWRRFQGGGDGTSEAARLVFGESDLRELRRERRRDDDPLTPAGPDADRPLCYAEHLWGAIEASAHVVELGAS
jgi:exodeoxyribonuclease V gamma subunit